jgi:hypothetical protein
MNDALPESAEALFRLMLNVMEESGPQIDGMPTVGPTRSVARSL